MKNDGKGKVEVPTERKPVVRSEESQAASKAARATARMRALTATIARLEDELMAAKLELSNAKVAFREAIATQAALAGVVIDMPKPKEYPKEEENEADEEDDDDHYLPGGAQGARR